MTKYPKSNKLSKNGTGNEKNEEIKNTKKASVIVKDIEKTKKANDKKLNDEKNKDIEIKKIKKVNDKKANDEENKDIEIKKTKKLNDKKSSDIVKDIEIKKTKKVNDKKSSDEKSSEKNSNDKKSTEKKSNKEVDNLKDLDFKNVDKINNYAFDTETERINRTIRKINKHGYKISLAKTWAQFVKESQSKDDNAHEKSFYGKKYLKYLEDLALKIMQNLDFEEIIENENALHTLDKFSFRANGFLQYIKYNIWDVDLNKSEDELLNIFLLDWYDLSENERMRYRKLGDKSIKRYGDIRRHMVKIGYIIENYMDIDIAWDSDEEWED